MSNDILLSRRLVNSEEQKQQQQQQQQQLGAAAAAGVIGGSASGGGSTNNGGYECTGGGGHNVYGGATVNRRSGGDSDRGGEVSGGIVVRGSTEEGVGDGVDSHDTTSDRCSTITTTTPVDFHEIRSFNNDPLTVTSPSSSTLLLSTYRRNSFYGAAAVAVVGAAAGGGASDSDNAAVATKCREISSRATNEEDNDDYEQDEAEEEGGEAVEEEGVEEQEGEEQEEEEEYVFRAVAGTKSAAASASTSVAISTATTAAASTVASVTRDNDNMVAAMNEHLSTSTSATTSTTTTSSSNIASTNSVSVTANNNSSNTNNNSNNAFQNVDEQGKPLAPGILSFPCDFDHMYASMTDDGGTPAAAATATSALGVSPLRGNEPRQNDLTEVKHLKELLLLHLDLIQQQSEQIVTKDKLLAALRQENETLKLRLERMDRRVNLQKLRSENNENSIASEHIGACSPPSLNSVNTPSTSDVHRNIQSESSGTQYNESFKIRLNTSGGITTVKQEPNDNQNKLEKQDVSSESRLEWEEKKKRRSDCTPLTSASKRKRGVSCSSTVSNDTSSMIQDKQSLHDVNRKTDRKGKSLVKKESFLTTDEHYYTAVGDSSYTLSLKEPHPQDTNTTLEVPNWRVKVYTSCYTMEGTENLDDEIFNKRHLKLENDERRRKRWDVQRIREQRHIEKLKQRQERQNHQATCYNTNHTGPCPSTMEEETVTSLWPDVDQIQSIQVDPQLPVTAFGAPIPSFTPSEFSLPWSNTVRTKSRRSKRSTGRRKTSRR